MHMHQIGTMTRTSTLSYRTTEMIGEHCLCLRIQQASRRIGRRFDEALRPVGLNNWQFSLLMTLNQPTPLTVSGLAEALAMDRTTTTKNLRPLERRGLLAIRHDEEDARVRRIVLTGSGRALLAKAVRHWQAANDAVAASLKGGDLASVYTALDKIASA
jgi:DNA-binding MarR family transcriptional regulator